LNGFAAGVGDAVHCRPPQRRHCAPGEERGRRGCGTAKATLIGVRYRNVPRAR